MPTKTVRVLTAEQVTGLMPAVRNEKKLDGKAEETPV
jgi:hypothetical protein